MEIPTVKSCCCYDLKTVGLMLGFFQVFIYGLLVLINISFGGYLLVPIILMPIATNLSWIYGIQQKKPMLLLPAMVPFVFALLMCICFLAIYPIGVGFVGPAIARRSEVCTKYEYYSSCTSQKQILSDEAGALLGIWIFGCAVTFYKFVAQDNKLSQRLPASSQIVA